MSEQTQLIPVETVNAAVVFGADSTVLDDLLQRIRAEALSHVPDLSTDASRKEIASVAYKVARSKTAIDGAGKDLVADMKKQAAVIDERRKHARDFLDKVRDEARAPLTEWEAEQARKAEEERQAAELELLHMEALRENELFDREAAVKREQEELRKQREEQGRRDREAAEAEQRRKDAEAAEERGRQQVEAALKREQEAKEAAERRAKEAEERAEKNRLAAIEQERERARKEAEEKENQRKAEEERKRQEEAARAADKANRDKVNGEIFAAFVNDGLGERTAEKVLRLLVSGGVPNVTVKY